MSLKTSNKKFNQIKGEKHMVALIFFVALFIIGSIVVSFIELGLRKEKQEYQGLIDAGCDSWDERSYKSKITKIEDFEKKINKVKKLLSIITLVGIVVTTIFSSAYIIGEQNLAVITTFGKAESVSGTGIHFKIPFIQKVKKLDATIQGFPIGYQEEDNESQLTDSLMITSDFNFVNVDFYVEYRIDDPITYLYGSSDPEGTLKNIAQAAIRNTIGRYDVDSVLTTGKSEIQATIKEDIVKELETTNTGLTLINITIQDSEPPTEEVKAAFKKVETARQGSEEKLNDAEKYRNEKIQQAVAEADAIIREAEAQKQERIDEATGEVAMFNAMYAEYIKDPDVTKVRIYYEAMEEMLPNLQIIVNGTDSEIKPIIVQDVKSIQNVNTEESTQNVNTVESTQNVNTVKSTEEVN